MKDKMIWIGVFVAMSIIVLAFVNREDDFYSEAKKAYDEIDYFFVNSIDVKDQEMKSIKWVKDYALKLEEAPWKYSEEKHVTINSLITMVVNVGLMNSINYRDREMEEEYYNARDNVRIILFDELE